MSCTTCPVGLPINYCADEITIGDAPGAAPGDVARVEDLASRSVTEADVIINGYTGQVSFVSPPLQPGHAVSVQIINATTGAPVPFTPLYWDGQILTTYPSAVTCMQVRAEKRMALGGTVITSTNEYLVIDGTT